MKGNQNVFSRICYSLVIVLFVSILFPPSLRGKSVGKKNAVTLQLRWDYQFQFAGYLAADWQGFYEDEGLEVTIKSALTTEGKILSAIQEVTENRADFGIGGADILTAYDKGADLTVTAVIFQQSAARFFIKEETEFNSLTDLYKLKVARKENDLIDIELQALLLSEGLDITRLKTIAHQPGYDNLIAGKIHIIPGYSISVPYAAKELGLQLKVIRPASYGIDFYGDSLFTRHTLVKKDPELVERFVRASIKGWEYALSNKEEIALKIAADLPRIAKIEDKKAFNLFQAGAINELTLYPLVELGHINPYRWEKMYNYQKKIGLVSRELDLDRFIFNPERIKKSREKRVRTILLWTVILSCITVLIFLTWVYFLRLQVKRRTFQLETELEKRTNTERTLRAKENLLLNIAKNYPNSYISIINEDFTVGFTSGKEFSKQNLNPDDFVGLALEDVFGEHVQIVKEQYQKAFAGEEVSFELFINNQYQVYHAVPLMEEDGLIRSILTVVENITERKQTALQIEHSLKEKEILLRELYHRTKNNMQIISSLLTLKGLFSNNEELIAIINEVKGRIQAMALVHQMLYESNDLSKINFKSYLTELCPLLLSSYGTGSARIELEIEAEEISALIDTAIPVGLVISELMSNVLKHAFTGSKDGEAGKVHIVLSRNGPEEITLVFADNGNGLPEHFDPQNKDTLGMQTIIRIVEQQLKGHIEFKNKNGLTCIITLKENLYSQRI